MASRQSRPTPEPAVHVDLIVAAAADRTVLLGGFLAGVAVFFTPLLILAVGLLAAYLVYVASDGSAPVFGLGRPLEVTDFRGVFAPAVNEFPLLIGAGAAGAIVAQFRRRLARRTDPAFLAAGVRPFFPEFTLLYLLLVALTLGMAATHGGWPQVRRLVGAAPVYLPFMLCATWLAHAVWQYCFGNLIDLLATPGDRDAASALRSRARLLARHKPVPR